LGGTLERRDAAFEFGAEFPRFFFNIFKSHFQIAAPPFDPPEPDVTFASRPFNFASRPRRYTRPRRLRMSAET